jgi:hypothetical protein
LHPASTASIHERKKYDASKANITSPSAPSLFIRMVFHFIVKRFSTKSVIEFSMKLNNAGDQNPNRTPAITNTYEKTSNH